MLDSCVFWQMAQPTRVLPSSSLFMFAVQDPTGAPPLTLHTLFVLHLWMPLGLLLLYIQKGLQTLSTDESVLKKKLACSNFDGASVMMGKKSGVAKQLQDIAQHPVCIIHCVHTIWSWLC